ncbi:hypothetical protein GCM10027454_28870 [Algoriphagus aestuariicola]
MGKGRKSELVTFTKFELLKSYLSILSYFFAINQFALCQDLSGTWRWAEEKDNLFEIFLEKTDPDQKLNYDFLGTHCGVYYNGERIDCMLEDFSIFLDRHCQNIFSGKITSAYSHSDFEIRLTYLVDGQKILWEVTKKGDGQFYFPVKEVLKQN